MGNNILETTEMDLQNLMCDHPEHRIIQSQISAINRNAAITDQSPIDLSSSNHAGS